MYEADAVVAEVVAQAPEVVLLDISMSGKSGLELAREIQESMPDVKIIMVSVHDAPTYVEEVFRIGASGYVLKSAVAAEISTAVHEVHLGRTYISHSLARRKRPGGFSFPN